MPRFSSSIFCNPQCILRITKYNLISHFHYHYYHHFPNPSEIVGSERMRELLAALAEQAIVIVDAPPLIPVTDAAIIANRADGAIVVATVGKTTFDVLGKALGNLHRAGGRALGVVLNRVPRRGSGAAYYGYQYTGEYYRGAGVDAADGAIDQVDSVPGELNDLLTDAAKPPLRRQRA